MSAARKAPPLVEALARPGAIPDATAPVRLVETHISWVLLTGRFAYKIKKAIELPFLDFRSLDARKRYCDEELRLNRRLAPDIYIDVVAIGGTPDEPRIGATPAIEYAVKMRQFADDARLDRKLAAGGVPPGAIAEFAQELAAFHARLPELPNEDPPTAEAAVVTAAVRDNVRDLCELAAATPLAERLRPLREWTEAQCARTAPAIARRLAGRAQKECHGDLHLENLLLEDGKIAAFDALEFDRNLREIDVVSEASFVAMDLMAHGRADFAYLFLARYFEASGDYAGLEVLRFYLVYRALIRAKVRAVKGAQAGDEALDLRPLAPYVDVAAQLIAERQPLLVITRGFSGSGKTHVTGELLGAFGALRVRSDLERKRLHGLAPDAKSGSSIGAGLYTRARNAQTYDRLRTVAAAALDQRFDMVVDATFLYRAERASFQALAAQHGARFAILDCTAPANVLRARVQERAARGNDASEAGLDVLERQLAHADPLDAQEQALTVTVDTSMELDREAVARRLRETG